jgi:acetyl-CoA carboxylase biotin carboxyl carrier protein
VGTFYRSPSPTADAFVSVGDRVAPGQTLCIVEAMKVMNEIEAEFGGTIREILVEDGSPIEAEAALFLVEPD